uniref:Reverse transcriptase domain-containing protein n=1 Tax=Glossina palpalis gambiensis TaxID=67801 RepID=A0A1B0B7Z7_9MUSC
MLRHSKGSMVKVKHPLAVLSLVSGGTWEPQKLYSSCKKTVRTFEAGIKVNGQFLNNLRYLNDATILVDKVDNLDTTVQAAKDKSNSFGLNLNIRTTKLVIGASRVKASYRNATLSIDNQKVESVSKFLIFLARIDVSLRQII